VVKAVGAAGSKVVDGVVDSTTGEGKTPKAKDSLAQTSFPDMPKDNKIKAKATSKETPISEIAKTKHASHSKSSSKALSQTKEPVAMPPFTSGII